MDHHDKHLIPENTSATPHVKGAHCWCHPTLTFQYDEGIKHEVATYQHRGELLTDDGVQMRGEII